VRGAPCTIESMETDSIDDASSDPALTPFVTATEAEIAYAEELLRQIEQRYLGSQNHSAAHSDASAD
jgi:hypothetical protein